MEAVPTRSVRWGFESVTLKLGAFSTGDRHSDTTYLPHTVGKHSSDSDKGQAPQEETLS